MKTDSFRMGGVFSFYDNGGGVCGHTVTCASGHTVAYAGGHTVEVQLNLRGSLALMVLYAAVHALRKLCEFSIPALRTGVKTAPSVLPEFYFVWPRGVWQKWVRKQALRIQQMSILYGRGVFGKVGGGHTVAYAGGHTVASVDPTGYACAIMKRSTAWQQNTLPTQWRFIEALRI